MLTRLYIDNFRCFEKFEYRPGQRQLILGENGSGKSSFMDALLFLQRLIVHGQKLRDLAREDQATRWLHRSSQTFELEALIAGDVYTYRFEADSVFPLVLSESLHRNDEPVLELNSEGLVVYRSGQPEGPREADLGRSALETSFLGDALPFKKWLTGLQCFKLNPFAMNSRAQRESRQPDPSLSNIAEWYRHLVQESPNVPAEIAKSLKASLDGFRVLKLKEAGENVRVLVAEFERGATGIEFSFSELSEGQRCLICLYTILSFVLAKGGTVFIDEPENFLSLRELQPWLMAASDTIEESGGQLLIISHHPEFMNQWAPEFGVRFVRDGMGPVRVEKYQGDPESGLSPSELIARGWENA